MTRTEALLNDYFSTEDNTLADFIEIIANENDSLNDMYQELKAILLWFNNEVK